MKSLCVCLIPSGLPNVQTRRYKSWRQLCCIHERIYQLCNMPFPATPWAVCSHHYTHKLHTVCTLAATRDQGQLLLRTFRQSASPTTKTSTERNTDSCLQCTPTHRHAIHQSDVRRTIHVQTDLHSTSPLTQNQESLLEDIYYLQCRKHM